MSSSSNSEPVLYRYTLPSPTTFDKHSPIVDPGKGSISQSIVFTIAKSNGTPVLKSLVLASYANENLSPLCVVDCQNSRPGTAFSLFPEVQLGVRQSFGFRWNALTHLTATP